MPARELQFIGEHILRPTVLVALASDQPPNEIPLLHVQTAQILTFAGTPLPGFLDKMTFRLIFYAFISELASPACDEFITTLHSCPAAQWRVFTVLFLTEFGTTFVSF
jgi:hypothetical protein